MQVYDIFMLAVLGAAIAFGAWKGFAWQVASMAGIFLSYYVACQFRGPVAGLIGAAPPWNMFLAMLILYVGTSLVVWIGFGFIRKLLDSVKLQDFDRQIGAMLGFAKGVVLCVIVTLFAVTLLNESQKQAVYQSRSGHYIALLLDKAHAVMPAELDGVLRPYLNHLDSKLEQGRAGRDQGSSHHDSQDRGVEDESAEQPRDLFSLPAERTARALTDAAKDMANDALRTAR